MTDVTHTLQLALRQPHPHVTIAALVGDIDMLSAPALRAQALEVIQQGPPHVVLDLTRVGFCDSSGLSALIGIWHAARAAGGSLSLAGAPDRLIRMLALTGVDSLFAVHATAADAVTAVTAG
ncbi:anti-sigma factor antagonist [Streptomyces sp. BG9H]|uniref:Anti-sigma factor antagonist n=1 Tax=Streptomyces anatolicus TaxID=2675858 RepID=A0ABS6YG28_9ACTN|nr:STAS domain-containing protein [Streptomyces anatolicus]MBW5420373.1 anti-sigma factor antagonist [Streptomyces anatolicus]